MPPLLHRFIIVAIFSGSLALIAFGLGSFLDPAEVALIMQHTILLSAALGACVLAGIAFVWIGESTWGPLTWPWQRMISVVDAPSTALLSYARNKLESIGARIEKETGASLRATKGSWREVGGKQVITVQCMQLEHGTQLTIRSRPQVVTTLIDGGQNARNISETFLALKKLFREQLVADDSNPSQKVCN